MIGRRGARNVILQTAVIPFAGIPEEKLPAVHQALNSKLVLVKRGFRKKKRRLFTFSFRCLLVRRPHRVEVRRFKTTTACLGVLPIHHVVKTARLHRCKHVLANLDTSTTSLCVNCTGLRAVPAVFCTGSDAFHSPPFDLPTLIAASVVRSICLFSLPFPTLFQRFWAPNERQTQQ